MTKREAWEAFRRNLNLPQENKEKKVFISGPITGLDTDEYVIRFEHAEYALYGQGFTEVINPTVLSLVLPKLPWETYMEMLLPLLKQCDAIYSLAGWEKSAGARIEREYAQRLGLELMEEER